MAASGAYASALSDLRDAVKWIMAAFTGGGAIVFSGLTITNISSLAQNGQWLLPVGLAFIPLAAAVFAIVMSMRVINVTAPSAGSIFPRYWEKIGGAAQKQVKSTPELASELPNAIGVYGSADAFDSRLIEAYEEIDHARKLKLEDDTLERQAALDQALTVLDGLQATVKDALDCAAYTQARGAFRAFGWWVLLGTFVALGGVIASGVVTGELQHNEQVASAQAATAAAPALALFRSPTPVQVWLTSRHPTAAGGPDACPLWDGMPAIAVGGTPDRPVLLFPGYTSSAARSHGIRSASSHCDDPWLWTAKTGEALVVPR
jgi:hypothetical protein